MKRTPFKKKKEKLPSINSLAKTAWRLMSKYVRLRDDLTCFTCGKQADTLASCQAGHYKHAPKKSIISYDERQINCQCINCNHFKSGNLAIYALKLEEKYGYGILQELEQKKKRCDGMSILERKEWFINKIDELKTKIEEVEG
jgi:hypothetical protein